MENGEWRMQNGKPMLPLVSKRGENGKAFVTRMINMNYKFITITHSLQTNGSKKKN